MLFFGIILAGFVFWRGILPLQLSWRWKGALCVALCLVAFKFHLLHLIGGPMYFAPELPREILLVAAWLFAVLFLFFFLLVASELIRAGVLLGLLAAGKRRMERFRTIGNRVNLALLVLATVLASVGIFCGTKLPAVRERTVVIAGLPEEAEGLTVAVLADLHADGVTRRSRVEKIVERTNALKPDLIALVGDFVDGRVEARGRELKPLAALSARYGVFGVPGNHEYYSGYREWIAFLSSLGIEMLCNEHRFLPERNVAVSGVTDPAASRMGETPPDVERALAGIPAGALKLLLAHQPKLAPEAAEAGADLQISAHTHGGMVRGVDQLVAWFNDGFVSGLYRVGYMTLFLTNGTGIWSGFPIRLGVPSEIALLRLVGEGKENKRERNECPDTDA